MNRHERETYDDALDACADPGECPVCAGGDGPACSEECDAVMMRYARRDRIRGLTKQAKAALAMARIYRAEEGPGGSRERRCLDVVAGCRIQARLIRTMARLEGRSAS